MKHFTIILAALLLSALAASAQTETYSVTQSGWGRLEVKPRVVGVTSYDYMVSEVDIHRWRKAEGELILDKEYKRLTLRLARKEIDYVLLTDSYVHQSKDGWSYVEHQALENDRTYCRVWDCTHEDGSRQILVLYPSFVQGYKITPVK